MRDGVDRWREESQVIRKASSGATPPQTKRPPRFASPATRCAVAAKQCSCTFSSSPTRVPGNQSRLRNSPEKNDDPEWQNRREEHPAPPVQTPAQTPAEEKIDNAYGRSSNLIPFFPSSSFGFLLQQRTIEQKGNGSTVKKQCKALAYR